MQVLGVGDHDAALVPEDHLGGLEGGQARETGLVEPPVAVAAHGQQVGMVRRWERPDEMQRRVVDQLDVVG